MMTNPKAFPNRSEALLLSYTERVRCIAHHLFRRRHYVDVDDLIRAGMIGLMEAIREHGSETTGFFEAHASVRIREAMLEFVRESDWSLRSGRRPLRCVDEERASV